MVQPASGGDAYRCQSGAQTDNPSRVHAEKSNRARSLIFSFCNGNPSQLHAADGSGYVFWAEQVIALNKQIKSYVAENGRGQGFSGG